jgi:hypothetical protein
MKTVFQMYPFPFNDTDFTYKEDGVFIITIGGGYNGGKCNKKFSESWEEYFANLSTLVKNASSNGICMWMIEASNDCLDDMFSIRFGIRKKPQD